MMKTERILIFSILLNASLLMNAQEKHGSVSFSLITGYGSYGMKDLKRINEVVAGSLPFDVRTINNFEPRIFFGASLKYMISKDYYLAAGYENYSTGSRIGQKDYSGYYAYDQIVSGQFVSIEPGIVFGSRHFAVTTCIPVGLMFSSLKIEENFIVGDSERHDDLKVVALSAIFVPSFKLNIPVTSIFGFTCGAGWMFDTGGKFHMKGEKKAILDVDGPIQSGWQGWRLSAGITITIARKNTTIKEFKKSEYFDHVQ